MISVTYDFAAVKKLQVLMRRAGPQAQGVLQELRLGLLAFAATGRPVFTFVAGGGVGQPVTVTACLGAAGADFHILDLRLPTRVTDQAYMLEAGRLEAQAVAYHGMRGGDGLTVYPAREMAQMARHLLEMDLQTCGAGWRAMGSFMSDLRREMPLVAAGKMRPSDAVIRAKERIIRKMTWLAAARSA